MRPLTVSTENDSAPLPCRRLPLCGWAGGGESHLGGVEAELHGGLVGALAEAGEQVADLLLAAGDDAAGGGLVDGGGDVAAELLEVAAQQGGQLVGTGLGLGVHGAPGKWGGGLGPPSAPSQPMTSRKICQTHLVGGRAAFALAIRSGWKSPSGL